MTLNYPKNARNQKGTANNNAKLTSLEVLEMREMFKAGTANAVIAEKFRIHPRTVSNIKCGKRWASVGQVEGVPDACLLD